MKLKISFLSDRNSWKNNYLRSFIEKLKKRGMSVMWFHSPSKAVKADITFFVGLTKIVNQKQLSRSKLNIVVHESALPQGRGWSPMSWQILEGRNRIPISLIEAAPKPDQGAVFLRDSVLLDGSELVDEWRMKVFEVIEKLISEFISRYKDGVLKPKKQRGRSTYYRRRTAKDMALNPRQSIVSCFNLFRIADNNRYPVLFRWRKADYKLKIYKVRGKDPCKRSGQ